MVELFSSHSIRTRLPTWMSIESRTIDRSVRNVVPVGGTTVKNREIVVVSRRHRWFMALKEQMNNSKGSRKKGNWTQAEKLKVMIYEMQFQLPFSFSLFFLLRPLSSIIDEQRGLRQSFTCLDRWLMTRSTSLRSMMGSSSLSLSLSLSLWTLHVADTRVDLLVIKEFSCQERDKRMSLIN